MYIEPNGFPGSVGLAAGTTLDEDVGGLHGADDPPLEDVRDAPRPRHARDVQHPARDRDRRERRPPRARRRSPPPAASQLLLSSRAAAAPSAAWSACGRRRRRWQADRQPDAEPRPVRPAEAEDHRPADDDAEDRERAAPAGPEVARDARAACTRRIQTPAHTSMNANSVPMLVMSPTMSLGDERRRTGRRTRRRSGSTCTASGSAGAARENDRRHQPVVAHREEDARLPQQHDQDDRREPGQDRDGHDVASQLVPVHVRLDREGHRASLAVGAEVLHRGDAGQDVRERGCRARCRSPASRGCRSACRAAGSSPPARRSRPRRSR